jgi:ABC-type Na+ transport system ATPase subunit NatA
MALRYNDTKKCCIVTGIAIARAILKDPKILILDEGKHNLIIWVNEMTTFSFRIFVIFI